jgi:hypothetical protein
MSRSYRKFPSLPRGRHYSRDSSHWWTYRVLERQCVRKEMVAPAYGDVVFPKYRGDGHCADYCSLKEKRDKYFRNIRNILNGYTEYFSNGNLREDSQADFNQHYHTVKNGEIPYENRQGSSFEWLYDKGIRKTIKAWQGEPPDVLYYLTRHRFIEKAVVCAYRMEAVSR